MGWWFGRKSAPADARPFVPSWSALGLRTDAAEEGFARSIDGLSVYVKSQGLWASYRAGSWEMGQIGGSTLVIDDQQVVGGREAAIPSVTGGTVVDNEARATIELILGAMRQHGLIET